MITPFKSSRHLAALLLLIGIGLSGCAGFATSPPAAIQQQIEAARTPADHEALASYYVKEAASARAGADNHRRMGRAYQLAPAGNRGAGSMPAHCNATAASYQEIASRFDAMAAEHRQMAGQAKP